MALVASHAVRWWGEADPPVPGDLRVIEVESLTADGGAGRSTIRLAFREWGSAAGSTRAAGESARTVAGQASSQVSGQVSGQGRTPVLLLHGSPGSHRDFDRLAPQLAGVHGLVAPDLPGFGASSHDVPDYSIKAHARYCLELLDRLEIDRVHLVGFSMGGGVALELGALAPERVRSLSLISSIGVQEMELLGSYSLNHLIHGLQLAGIWVLQEGVPHFGMLDGGMLGLPYARNFFDTDQRPLRRILQEWQSPVLIVHGEDDFLVPPEAAREHARLVPQAETHLLDTSHFFLFSGEEPLPGLLAEFLARVDAGVGMTRQAAPPSALARAAEPYLSSAAPPWMGPALLVVVLLLALSTFVSEDLTCIGAGLLVAQGRLPLFTAMVACFVGIFVGDLLLYAAGRFIGRPIVRLPPMRWWLSAESLRVSEAWFERRGAWAIGLGRFVPGTRLPTYVAAGVLKAPFWQCSFYFLVAAAVWTPLLVGLAFFTGVAAIDRVESLQEQGLILLVLLIGVLWIFRGLVLPMATWRGRRRLLGRWRRISHWEFWPAWMAYPPVVIACLFYGFRHRGLLAFTATNPGIPGGGIVGESKAAILGLLAPLGEAVPVWREVPPGPIVERLAIVRDFKDEHDLQRVVLKPDVGQRGTGVVVVESDDLARSHLLAHPEPFLAQEYVPGLEYGLFWVREPGSKRGRILSITEKCHATVTGDGRRSLEDLVLADRRAVALVDVYRREMGGSWLEIPPAGAVVELGEIGAHSRGALFLRGSQHITEELQSTLQGWADAIVGFDFGRYDVRVGSATELEEGRGLRILELNGVTSESTDIYDPQNRVRWIYRRLFEQWRIAYAIGAANRDRGNRVMKLRELLKLLWLHRRQLP